MDKSDRIGLLGGSFDPIHLGHINMGLRAIEELQLDKVFFITAKNSPFKVNKSRLSASQRHSLVEKALDDYPKLEASDLELNREEEISYSYQTIRDYSALYPEAKLFWLMGDDAFKDLSKWKNFETAILGKVDFIVFNRDGNFVENETIEIDSSSSRIYQIKNFDYLVSSSEIKENKIEIEKWLPNNIVEEYKVLR